MWNVLSPSRTYSSWSRPSGNGSGATASSGPGRVQAAGSCRAAEPPQHLGDLGVAVEVAHDLPALA